jgi:hypothetical protein
VTHDIAEIRTPIAIIVRCSCGWSRQVTRKQNALARASQVRAKIREHEYDISQEPFKQTVTSNY